ncbi:MAG: rRNA maturation RNase YbeY [Gemmatimonadetes bacterium]|nr:MAG: rRNA maturation RNase YbeY [Gemmatimonadota bacterium]PYP05364.1 MAG: rRNA maturation RNase YbeY [Gemmatimonadota bacterium]
MRSPVAASRRRGNLRPRLERAVGQILAWEGARGRRARVELALLDAAAMRRLNRRVTGRRGLTDVLAFALPQPDGALLGDVYICPAAAERWVRNGGRGTGDARRVEEELVRLTVHGTLHVLGYDHPDGPGRTRSAMWRRQERYVHRVLGRRGAER